MLKSHLDVAPLWVTLLEQEFGLGGLPRSLPPPQLCGGGIKRSQSGMSFGRARSSRCARLCQLSNRKHLSKSPPKNVGKWPLFLRGRGLWLPTRQTGTAGIPQQGWGRSSALHPGPSSALPQQPRVLPPTGDHGALTSRETSQPLIIGINMQIAGVSWGRKGCGGEPGNVQKEAIAPVTFC